MISYLELTIFLGKKFSLHSTHKFMIGVWLSEVKLLVYAFDVKYEGKIVSCLAVEYFKRHGECVFRMLHISIGSFLNETVYLSISSQS